MTKINFRNSLFGDVFEQNYFFIFEYKHGNDILRPPSLSKLTP